MTVTWTPRPGRSKPLITSLQTDFTGGLNLKADAFQLADNEVMDVCNLDMDARGGFFQRKALSCFNTALTPYVPKNIWPYVSAGGTAYVIIQQGSDLAYSTAGGTFTHLNPDALATTGVMNAAEMKDLFFVQRNAEQVAFKWDGTTVTVLGTSFVDDFAAPTAANMPKAKYITSWGGYMWVANTVESGSKYGSRVRFSHPNQPGDWRTNDYFDLDIGRDGDEITALLPLGDRLFVFKNRSVHVVVGYDANSFATYEISRTVGAVSQQAVAATEYGIYTFSWPDGLFVITSERDHPVRQFERIEEVLDDVTVSSIANITLGWVNRRLWVNLPTGVSTTPNVSYVLDPSTARPRRGQEGAWTKYDVAIGPMMEWRRSGAATKYLGCSPTVGRVYDVNTAADQDEFCTSALVLDGTSGCYASTPDTAGLSVVGDLDLRAWVQATDWTPASDQAIIAKWTESGNQRSYKLSLDSTGVLILEWSNNGTAVISKISTAIAGVPDGTGKFVRATLDVDNGAAGNDVKFYLSDDGLTWTQLGSTVTTAGVTSIFNSTAVVEVGSKNVGTGERFIGEIYRAEIRNGIGGSVVGDPDFTKITYAATTITDGAGQVWTPAGAATLTKADPEIASWLTTRWIDDGSPQVVKRWKRPEIVLEGGKDRTIRLDVWRDYDASEIRRTLYVTTDGVAGTLEWDLENWDEENWGGDDALIQEIERSSALGRARSVRLKFTKETTGVDWGISALIFKYKPKKVRG